MKQFLVKVNGNSYEVTVDEMGVIPESAAKSTQPAAEAKQEAPKASVSGGTNVTSPMPGTILKVLVKAGDAVEENQPVIVLEAMKMENDIPAPVSGKVVSVETKQGDSVESGQTLLVIG